MAEASRPEFSKKRLRAFKVLAVTLPVLLFCLAYYLFFWFEIRLFYDRDKLTGSNFSDPDFPYVSEKQLVNLGWAHAPDRDPAPPNAPVPASSYVFFPKEKPPGVFRIGVFGCSYAEGYEAGWQLDFPSLLQQKLRVEWGDSVEVINFGVSSYGLHQSFLLHEYVGKDFDLDVILLNAWWFHAERDNTFRTYGNYGPIHARYVLEEGRLKLIEVVGGSRAEAMSVYHSFFPPAVYRTYDIRMPNFLRPVKRIIKENPWYHYGDMSSESARKAEMRATYVAILDSLSRRAPRLLVVNYDDGIASLADELAGRAENVTFFRSGVLTPDSLSESLFRAPGAHFSPWGNEFIANELANYFTGNTGNIPFLRMEPLPEPERKDRSPGADAIALADYDSVFVTVGPVVLRQLYGRVPRDPVAGRYLLPMKIAGSGIKAFLRFAPKGADYRLIPLDFFPADGSEIKLEVETSNGPRSVAIGTIEAQCPYVYQCRLKLPWAVQSTTEDPSYLISTNPVNEFFSVEFQCFGEVESAKITFAGRELGFSTELALTPDLPGVWHLSLGEDKLQIYAMRCQGKEFFPLDSTAAPTGAISLQTWQNGQPESWEFLRFRIDSLPYGQNLFLPAR